MRTLRMRREALGALLAVTALAAPAATVQVEFADPAKFTDAGREYAHERDETLAELRRHLVERAGRWLAEDERLAVTVTDVDLAGSFEQSQRYSREVRVVRRTYPPRIDLAFRLTRGPAVVKEGTRRLGDHAFAETLRYKDDPLGYEKQLLDDWLRREFAAPAPR